MKCLVLTLVSLLVLGTGACRVIHRDQAQRQSNLIRDYGEWRCFPSLLVIVSRTDRKISVTHFESEGSTVQTAADWRTGKGWFVFVESAERIWIYNGNDLRLLLISPRVGSSIYLH